MSVADKIYMPPSGGTYFMGLRAEIPFFKNMLDAVGVTPEFVYIGKYKTAPQIFMMDHISDEYREVINDLLERLYNGYVERIAEARNVSEDTVGTWVDDGIYSAADALQAGVIDEILYESQVDNAIQLELGLIEKTEESGEANDAETEEKDAEANNTEKGNDKKTPELNKISSGQYTRVEVNVPQLHRKGKKIAVIYAQGGIVSGKGALPISENPMIGCKTMTKLFSTLADDDEIKGIIFRVDSGGGGARASDIIRNAVYEASQKKPVVVSMAGAAASGGYMISAPATSIVAYPLTLTGSIGIFGGKFSVEGLLELIKVNVEIIQRGKHAGIFSGTCPWNDEELELFRKNIQQGYDNFIGNVAEGRDMTVEEVDAVAQGRVWFGEQALEHGLVDKLGGFDTAVAVMEEKMGIPEDEDVQLVEYPKMEGVLEQLLHRIRQSSVKAGLPKQMQRLYAQLEELAQLQHEELFTWFPYQIIVE
jgi:protease-4